MVSCAAVIAMLCPISGTCVADQSARERFHHGPSGPGHGNPDPSRLPSLQRGVPLVDVTGVGGPLQHIHRPDLLALAEQRALPTAAAHGPSGALADLDDCYFMLHADQSVARGIVPPTLARPLAIHRAFVGVALLRQSGTTAIRWQDPFALDV